MNTNLADINSQASLYQNLAILLMIISISFLIATIVLWFAFDIRHSIKVLTRVGYKKEMKRMTNGGVQHANKAVLTWNTTGNLKTTGNLNTEEKDQSEDTVVLDDATVLLDDETVILDDETVLLDESKSLNTSRPGFEIEDEIKITGTNTTV